MRTKFFIEKLAGGFQESQDRTSFIQSQTNSPVTIQAETVSAGSKPQPVFRGRLGMVVVEYEYPKENNADTNTGSSQQTPRRQ